MFICTLQNMGRRGIFGGSTLRMPPSIEPGPRSEWTSMSSYLSELSFFFFWLVTNSTVHYTAVRVGSEQPRLVQLTLHLGLFLGLWPRPVTMYCTYSF